MAALRKLKGLVGDKADPDPNRELWDLVESAPVPEWITTTSCTHCGEAFSAHHNHNCRICGLQFCSQCTGKFHLPDRFQLKPNKKDESAQRVCYGCRDSLASKSANTKNIPRIPSRIFVPVWELKADAPECHKCHQKFKSNHHNCRACGKSFCSDCSSKRAMPPAFVKKGKTGPARVCDFCRYALIKGAVLDEDQSKARLTEEGKGADPDAKMDLRQVLDVPQYLAKLREYCSVNHARENLNFIDAVEVFEDAVSTTQAALFPLAKSIYHEFLVQTANQLVNLTSAEFDEIEDRMATGSVDSKLFRRAYDNVYKMVSKDVFRRFTHTEEAKKINGGVESEILKEYFEERHARLSFSIVQRLEDIELMQTLETELRKAPKLFHTIRQGLKSWSDAVEGSALVTHLCKTGRAKTRAEGMSVAARMVEAGYLHHAIDPTLSFYDSETSTNIYQLPQQSDMKRFPSASTLLQNPQNVSAFFLLRGMRYNRLWGICSVKEAQIYFWRQDKQPHFILPLKGVALVFETGGEIDEGDGDSHAFGVARSEKKDESAKGLRHGQVYLRVTMPSGAEKPPAEANETTEYVFLLEDSSMRTRWRKCFKECGLETTMVTHTGVSKRAAITGQVAKRGVVNDRAEINNQTAAMAEKVVKPPVSPSNAVGAASPSNANPPPPSLSTPPPPALTTPPPPALSTPPPPALTTPPPPALSTPPPPALNTPPPPAVSSPRPPALSTPPIPSPHERSRAPPPPSEEGSFQHMMQQKERQAAMLALEGDSSALSPPSSPRGDAKGAIPVRPKKASTKPGMGHSQSALSMPHKH